MKASTVTVLVVFCISSKVYAQHDNHEHHRVNVAVYYESMCPDSIKFFTQQLYPSLQGNLASYVNLTLLPYGKSKTTRVDDQFDFECHHGKAECKGNRIHACAIHLIEDGKNSIGLGFNKITTGFINCLMKELKREGDNTQFPTQNCASINKVQNVADIDNCANHPEGAKYLYEVGVETEKLKLNSVPTIVFNNKFQQGDNDMAQTNFVKALCQYVHGEKPAECSTNSASSGQLNVVVFVAVIAAFILNY